MTIGSPDSSTITTSLPNSFVLSVFSEGEEMTDGPVDCTVQEDESFVCTEFTSGWDLPGIDASVGLAGVITLSFSTDTDVEATADMIMTCTGNDCDVAGESAGISENPCSTTYTWNATYEGQ
jgi:hypothetical protein